ncbi:MAG: lysophospholipid acyltransferase family protein [Bacilli bacterium]
MNYFVLWFFKLTAWLPLALHYRRLKIDLRLKKKSLKGKILISNHHTVYDFPFILMTFFFNTIYVVAGEDLFKKPLMRWWVKSIGGIKSNRSNKDMSWLEKSEKLLKKGKTVLIFPQARYADDDEPPYKENFAILALNSKANIVPLYINGKYGKKERAKIVIGEEVSLYSLWDDELTPNVNFKNIAVHFQKLNKEHQAICDEK